MKAISVLAAMLCALPARAEVITARSPCLPATLPPSVDLDTGATSNKATLPPITLDIYKDLNLHGSIYGEAVVATVTVDPATGAMQGLQPDPFTSDPSTGCH